MSRVSRMASCQVEGQHGEEAEGSHGGLAGGMPGVLPGLLTALLIEQKSALGEVTLLKIRLSLSYFVVHNSTDSHPIVDTRFPS